MCDKFGHQTKEISWPDTDYSSCFIYKSLNMLLLLQGKSGTDWGGLLSLAILTDACCEVRRTLKRTTHFKFVKCVKVREPRLLAEPQTEQP